MSSIWHWRAFWWWLAWLMAALALSILAARCDYFAWDLTLARHIQAVNSTVLALSMDWASYMFGSWRFVILVLLAGILVWNRLGRRHVWTVVVAGAATYFNSVLKLMIGRPRPPVDLIRVVGDFSSSSFPSGHTFSAAMLAGALLLLIMQTNRGIFFKTMAAILATGVVGLVGASRVYLGAHWPSDVLGAWLWAGVWLIPLSRLVIGRRFGNA